MTLPQAPPIFTSETITEKSISAAYTQFLARRPRFDALWSYYIGDHPRTNPDGESFIVANFCKYISRTIKSYMIGNRPAYGYTDGDTYGEEITGIYRAQNKWEVDSAIIQDMINFGRGFELVYRDENGSPKSASVSPRDAFVAYSPGIEHESVFGAVRYHRVRDDGSHYTDLVIYTADSVQTWRSEDNGGFELAEGAQPHGFGRVPLIEYANNREFMSDYEDILSLQNAYNALLSDRQDDKDAFASAILWIKGAIMGNTEEAIKEKTDVLNRLRVLHLGEDADAGFLTHTLDESGVSILQEAYAKSIHKIAMVPDLSDEAFAGNASGVAMAYKLYGTDQVASEKASQFQKGYTRRCKLYDAALHNPSNSMTYTPLADIEGMTVQFRFNLVQDLGYTATALTTLKSAGLISTQTAMENISIIPDAKEELVRVEGDTEASIRNDQRRFEDYPSQFGPEDGDGE